MRNVDVQLNNVIFDVGHTYVIHNFEVEKNSDVIDEVVEIRQWNLYSKPKKVVFTIKDGWFRVDVKVVQPNEFTILTLWDRKCYALIKKTANEIKDIPEELDRVLGKILAFKFKVVPGNTRHSMSQLSDDDELTKFVISKLPTL
ncbi:hypothetical protein JHK87_027585 [Glycine soja]|nr:hypothetical protein JHK87_027585 [Glycine soja]